MPDFPRYESKAQIAPRQTSVQATDDTGPAMLEGVGKIGGVVQDATLKWSNAVDMIQKTTATANFKTGMLDITNRAANDPDYNNSESYFKEIEKLKTDSLKGFSSKSAEAQAAIDFGYDGKVAQIQIQNLYKKKMIDVGQASTLKLLDMEAASGSEGLDERVRNVLAPQIQAGVISHEAAYKLEKEYIRKGKYNSFLSDLNASPAETDKKLSNNEYDFDIDQLEKARNLYDSESKKIQAVTENDVLTSYLNGDPIGEEDVKQLLNDGKIDAKFAEGMIKKINDIPRPDAVSQDTAFIDFQNRVVDLQAKGDKADIGEITKLMSDVMQAHASGHLDKDDVQRILKDRNEVLQKKLEPLAEGVMEKASPKNWFDRLSFWSDEYADKKPDIKARMYRKLIDGMGKGQDGERLLEQVVNEEIELQMAANLNSPNRRYSVNLETKQRAYSDDGGATWVDEKTGKEIK